MIINHNINALNAHRNMMNNVNRAGKLMEKLSSGMRINRAGDDAAGLAISEKMRGQIRGLQVASRNAEDGISLIQTAEGALNETHSILNRMRELSVQAANDTNTEIDREQIQEEINQLTSEINRIGNTTEFNTKKILNGGSSGEASGEAKKDVLKGLKSWWISGGAKLVENTYGLKADDKNLKVVLDDNSKNANALAYVQYSAGSDGKSENLELHVNMKYFSNIDLTKDKDGNSDGQFLDRTIAHEMTHAIMGRTMNFNSMSKWFKEGTAEAVHGADGRLKADIQLAKGSSEKEKIQNVIKSLGNFTDGDWNQTSEEYSAAYIAVRFMDFQMAKNNSNNKEGIELVTKYLSDNPSKTLNDALKALGSDGTNKTPWKDEAAFIADLKAKITDMNSLKDNAGIILDNSDTGSILGADAESANGGFDSSKVINAADAVKEVGDAGSEIPTGTEKLGGFNITWPSEEEINSSSAIKLQIGANMGQAFGLSLGDMRAEALGISKKVSAPKPTPEPESKITKMESDDLSKSFLSTKESSDLGDLSTTSIDLSTADFTFKLAYDGGIAKELTLSKVNYDGSDDTHSLKALAKDIQDQIDADSDLKDKGIKVNVSEDGKKLVFQGDKTLTFGCGTTNDALGKIAGIGDSDNTAVKGIDLTSNNKLKLSIDGAESEITLTAEKYDGTSGKILEDLAKDIQSKIDGDSTLKDKGIKVELSQDKSKLVFQSEKVLEFKAASSNDVLGEIGGIDAGDKTTLAAVDNASGEDNDAAFTQKAAVTNGTDNKAVESALDISNHHNATEAIEVLDKAINKVSRERAKLGAAENRLEHTINNLNNTAENLIAAESRIRDMDMAKAMTELAKENILQQAAQAMLAQAKQQPQAVVQLLK